MAYQNKTKMIYVVKPKTTYTKWFNFLGIRMMISFRIPKFMR